MAPSARLRTETGAQKALSAPPSPMRAPRPSASACISPVWPGATGLNSGVGWCSISARRFALRP
jgi:hypothetical protein